MTRKIESDLCDPHRTSSYLKQVASIVLGEKDLIIQYTLSSRSSVTMNGDNLLKILKFPVKVSCGHLHESGREGIFHRFARKWANQLKIFV